jgi:hypothetical protein
VVKSKPSTIIVRGPATPEEEDIARLSMEPSVGRAFAFGDFGMDQDAKVKLEELANKYGHTETGAAASLTLANSHSRDLRDLYSGNVLRSVDSAEAQVRFNDVASSDIATEQPKKLVNLVTAVAAPTESDAPVLGLTADYLSNAAANEALADTADTSKQPKQADALDMLTDIRRCFVQSKPKAK